MRRISDKMEKLLNEQITNEANAAQVFLAYGSWADNEGYPGVAEFFYAHEAEEREHMKKFMRYVNGRGGSAKFESIKAAPENPKNLKDCFNKTLNHEVNNSNAINKIVDLALEEKDWATFNFAQSFVREQIEEETLVMNLIDKYNLASDEKENNENLYELDKDLEKASQHADIPREQ